MERVRPIAYPCGMLARPECGHALTVRPAHPSETPAGRGVPMRDMGHDTLSEVLRAVRLRGAVYFYVTGEADWSAEAPPGRDIAAEVMPGVDHVIEYHVVARGQCWAAVVGAAPVRLSEGDVVLFPQGDAHVVSSAPGLRPASDSRAEIIAAAHLPKPVPVAMRGPAPPVPIPDEGAPNVLVCGFLGCDLRPFNPLVASLPRLLHIPATGGSDWVATMMHQAVRETREHGAGSEAVLERLSEPMFVDAIRRHLGALPEGSRGWLAGLRDRTVGKALSLLHERPADPWTIERLSERVGLSRSALHDRFVHFVGHAPMQYLAHWRMQVAAGALAESSSPVASIALDVGYDSEAAFSRAFKRIVGVPPGEWRRRHRPGALSATNVEG